MIDPRSLNWQKSPDGLIPAIIQDVRTGRILMLGSMNEEALRKTLDTGNVTFFSRSKRRLWKKGEASGNTLRLDSISHDCDNDALLIRAIPKGATCHRGTASCFNSPELPLEILGELIETIRQRKDADAKCSYTKRLLDGGLDVYGAKVLEEAKEVVGAARKEGKQRTVEEAADLLYHFFVLLKGENIGVEEISYELQKRKRGRTRSATSS